MGKEHLLSCRQSIAGIVESTAEVCKKYAQRDPGIAAAVDRFQRVFEARINDLNPRIMVYGIYNAGKSTLLNALMGENKAAMNDVPTTVTVTPYQWKEYTIYDTPGINAPKKDEEVSKAQLEKCDVVIFVMDTEGAFNLAKNYRELVGVVKGRKKLLIVLNNKSSIEMDTPDGVSEIEKIKGNVYRDFAECYGEGTAEDMSRHFKIVVVDAKLALDARTTPSLSDEERAVMLEASNIKELESEIINVYATASGFTVLDEIAHLLSSQLDSVCTLLKNLEGDSLSRRGYETMDGLQKQQDNLSNKVRDYISDRIALLTDDVREILSSATDAEDAKARLSELLKAPVEDVKAYIVKELEKISGRVENCVVGFEQISPISLPQDVTPASEVVTPVVVDEQNPATNGPSDVQSSLESTAATAVMAKPLIDNGIKAALPIITKVPILGPILAPVLPVIGPILVTIAAIKILFGGEDKSKLEAQRAQLAAQMHERIARETEIARRKQEIVEKTRSLIRKIEFSMTAAYAEQIEEFFRPQFARIHDAISASNASAAEIAADLRVIEKAQRDLITTASTIRQGCL